MSTISAARPHKGLSWYIVPCSRRWRCRSRALKKPPKVQKYVQYTIYEVCNVMSYGQSSHYRCCSARIHVRSHQSIFWPCITRIMTLTDQNICCYISKVSNERPETQRNRIIILKKKNYRLIIVAGWSPSSLHLSLSSNFYTITVLHSVLCVSAVQARSRAYVGRHMRQSLYASTHPTSPPQSSSYPQPPPLLLPYTIYCSVWA